MIGGVLMTVLNDENGLPRIQLGVSPYAGCLDFSQLRQQEQRSDIDRTSLADLFRNAFVYPPYTIYRGVRAASLGFSLQDDLFGGTPLRFDFPWSDVDQDQVGTPEAVDEYHRRLCGAVERASLGMHSPWMLQSGGKDSTSLAIAVAEVRPDTQCITYLGGEEEDEVESARRVARTLGMRHESFVCDPGRAYDRYLSMVGRMPLLSADFALLSYADLATEVGLRGSDGILDGLGSDIYFGTSADRRFRFLAALARRLPVPSFLFKLPWVRGSFLASFVLGTLGMDSMERAFPGTRFNDREVDELLGEAISADSRKRLDRFWPALAQTASLHDRRDLSVVIAEGAAAFAKGGYVSEASGLKVGYPFCDRELARWVRSLPGSLRRDALTGMNKIIVRKHIEARFTQLPYVTGKGSFRFDLRALARLRYEYVRHLADTCSNTVPGAAGWLDKHRTLLGNKFHASKFYLLAVTLPWIEAHVENPDS